MDEAISPKRSAEQDDNSASQASFKRRRTALACSSCRTRKTRCNGERPFCIPCIELGLECIYETPANANANGRVQQATYDDRLRAIEETLRILVQIQNPSVQDTSLRNTAVDDFSPAMMRHSNGDRVVRLKDIESTDDANNEDTIDGMASYTDPSDSETRFYGPSSNIAFLRHLSAATSSTLREVESNYVPQDQQRTQPLISRVPSPINTPSAYSTSESYHINPLALPSEAQTSRLLELYFNETGLLFPFIQKSYVLATYNSAKAKNLHGMRKSFLCLLHSILAMSAHIDDDPDANPNDAETFYQRALALQSRIDLKMANVETVQSLLLMIQYRQGTQKSEDTWVLLGRAVRIAVQLGFHSSSSPIGLTLLEREVRKRIWHNCVSLDRVLSMTFGRPQTISKEYIRLDLPLNRDLDTLAVSHQTSAPQMIDEPQQTVCFFIATIKLYEILDFILATVYDHNLDIETQISPSDVLKHGLSVEQKLSDWENHLPNELKRCPWKETMQQSPSTYSRIFDKLSAIIHLRYLNVNLLHHRAILDRFLASLRTIETQHLLSGARDSFFLNFARHSLEVSQDCAMEIVDLVWNMSHRPGALGAWWFSAYYTFNACLVMYGSILVLFSLSRQGQYQIDTATQSGRQQKILRMITSLNTGVNVIERIGKGTRTAKGIRRTLIKIIQISTRLAQLHGQEFHSDGNIDGLVNDNEPIVSDTHHALADQEHQAVNVNAIQNEGWQDDLALGVSWEIPNLEFWTAQSDFDIFADLGSLDAGLGNFMAA